MKNSVIILILLAVFSGESLMAKNAGKDYLIIRQSVTGNVFLKTEPIIFKIQTTTQLITFTYKDYWNQLLGTDTLAVSGDTASIHIQTEKLGWFSLTVKSIRNGTALLEKTTSFAVLTEFDPSKFASSPFMVQTHSWEDYSKTIPVVARLGVKYVRDCFRWQEIEKTKGIYRFPAKFDTVMEQITGYGIRLYATMGVYNPLYDQGHFPVTKESVAAFTNYIKRVIDHYPQVKEVEIWNEPDLPTYSKGLTSWDERAEAYLNLLKSSFVYLKITRPDVLITGFVLSGNPKFTTVGFLDKLFLQGALSYVDQFSFHAYGLLPENIITVINQYRNYVKSQANGHTVPMILSETGNSNTSIDVYLQAGYTVRRIITALAHGISKVSIYNLQNQDTLSRDRESNFGLIRHPDDVLGAYVPKPAYVSYGVLIRELSGGRFLKTEKAPTFSYLFEKDHESVRVMYAHKSMQVIFHTTHSLKITDIMGNSRIESPINGSIKLLVNDQMIYVKGKISYIE